MNPLLRIDNRSTLEGICSSHHAEVAGRKLNPNFSMTLWLVIAKQIGMIGFLLFNFCSVILRLMLGISQLGITENRRFCWV